MGKIEGNQVIDDSLIQAPLELNKNMLVLLGTVEKVVTGLKKMESEINQATSSNKITEQNNKRKKSLTELEKIENRISKSREQSTQETLKQKAALDKLNKSNRDAVKDINAQSSAYDKLNRSLEKSRKSYKDLAAAGKANTKEARALKNEVSQLDAKIKKIDSSVGQNQRSVGKYGDALKGLGTRFLGVAGAITAFIGILRNGLQIIRNYTKANSTLNAVLGVTSKQTKALRLQQKALGETTAFSASEVAKAQTELARLGKTQREIVDLTPAILDAAVAMGVDLAQAAELVAGQLNAFNLEAEEGGRVSDVLVKATQISAFNFDRLKTSLAVVSPAANAVNASIEDTVAVLSSAVDANIDASTAATGLRNIYIDLADKGITWDDAMASINSSTNKLSTANELFGKRGAVVATVIAGNTEKIEANTKALENAGGAAKAFANETLKNLDGSITLIGSAWEGFILSLDDGEGVITRLSTAFVNLGTNILGALTQVNKFTASDTLSFWEKTRTLLGLASGNMGAVAASMAEIATTNAADEVIKMADALDEVEDAPRAVEKTTEATKGLTDAVNELRLAQVKRTEQNIADAEMIDQLIEDELAAQEKLNDELEELDIDRRESERKRREKAKKEEEKDDEKLQERKRKITELGIDAASEVANSLTDIKLQQIDRELSALEFARNRELEVEGLTAQQKDAINEKFNKKREDLEKKQLIAQKASSLFQIALNTAIAISKGIAQFGPPPSPPGIAAIAFASAIGLAQAAVVLAQKPPQFDAGSESTPSDYIAGEKRPELRKSKGKWSLVDRPTLFGGSPGDKIIGGSETDNILGKLSDLSGPNLLSNTNFIGGLETRKERNRNALVNEIARGNKELVKTIKNKATANISVSRQRTEVREKHGNNWVNRLDARYKGRV